MKEKKIVLWVSGIFGSLLIILILVLLYNLCGPYRQICKELYTPVAYLCFSFPVIFLLSLLTYRLRDEVFLAWWGFARWWVPIIVVATILLNTNSSGGGYIGMDSVFDSLIYTVLYGVLIIVSLVKIYRAYFRK